MERPMTGKWAVCSSSQVQEGFIVKHEWRRALSVNCGWNSYQTTMSEICGLAVWANHFIPKHRNYKVQCSSILVSILNYWTEIAVALRFGGTTCRVPHQLLSLGVRLYCDWLGGIQTSSTSVNVFALLFILTNSFFPILAPAVQWNKLVEGSVKPNLERTLQIDLPNSGGRQACGACAITWRWNTRTPGSHFMSVLLTNGSSFQMRTCYHCIFPLHRHHVVRKLNCVLTHFVMKTFHRWIKDTIKCYFALLQLI